MSVKVPLLVAASVLLGWLYGTWSHAAGGSSPDGPPVTSSSQQQDEGRADREREAQKTAALQKQVRQLEDRILEQERTRQAPSERDRTEPAAAPRTPEEALAAERAATVRAATILAHRFEASEPAPEVEKSYFSALQSSIKQHGLPMDALQEVRCTQALCRMRFRMGSLDRDALEPLWGKEPLRYGSFDFASEDGNERIVYAGLPNRPLEHPAPEPSEPSQAL